MASYSRFHKIQFLTAHCKDVPADEIGRMTDAELDEKYAAALKQKREREALAAKLREAQMPWNSAKATNPDWSYWAALDNWEAEEALALSFGKDPGSVNWGVVGKYHESVSPFVVEYSKRRTMMFRAVEMRQLFTKAEPRIFLRWAERKGIAYHAQLVKEVTSKGPIYDYKDGCDALQRVISQKDEEIARLKAAGATTAPGAHRQVKAGEGAGAHTQALLRILYAMAVHGFGYDPDARRDAAGLPAIREALETEGLSVDDATIRGWLKKAAETRPLRKPSLANELVAKPRKIRVK